MQGWDSPKKTVFTKRIEGSFRKGLSPETRETRISYIRDDQTVAIQMHSALYGLFEQGGNGKAQIITGLHANAFEKVPALYQVQEYRNRKGGGKHALFPLIQGHNLMQGIGGEFEMEMKAYEIWSWGWKYVTLRFCHHCIYRPKINEILWYEGDVPLEVIQTLYRKVIDKDCIKAVYVNENAFSHKHLASLLARNGKPSNYRGEKYEM